MTEDPRQTTTAIAEFQPIEAALAEIRRKYEGRVYEVSTAEGFKSAKAVVREIKAAMIALEKRRKATKERALRHCQNVDDGARRLKFGLSAVHDPIYKIVSAEEERQANERAEAERREAKRVADIQARIAALSPTFPIGTTSAQIAEALRQVNDTEIDDTFAEFEDDAFFARAESINRLRALFQETQNQESSHAAALEAARKAEEENTRLREQLAEQDRQRAADEAAKNAVPDELAREDGPPSCIVSAENIPVGLVAGLALTEEGAADDIFGAELLAPANLAQMNEGMRRTREAIGFAPLEMSYDYSDDSLTVEGVRYSGTFFRNMATCPINGWLKVVARDANGCVQVYQPTADASRSIDDWLEQIQIDDNDG